MNILGINPLLIVILMSNRGLEQGTRYTSGNDEGLS